MIDRVLESLIILFLFFITILSIHAKIMEDFKYFRKLSKLFRSLSEIELICKESTGNPLYFNLSDIKEYDLIVETFENGSVRVYCGSGGCEISDRICFGLPAVILKGSEKIPGKIMRCLK